MTADDIVNHPQDIPPAGDGRGDSEATRLVSLAPAHYRLVHGDDSRLYVAEHDGPAVVRSLRGKDGLRSKLSSLYFDIHHQAPGGAALTDALAVLEGKAERADREPVALRIADAGPGSVVLDLAGPDGRCVVVDTDGWRVAERAPVLFRRTPLTGSPSTRPPS